MKISEIFVEGFIQPVLELSNPHIAQQHDKHKQLPMKFDFE